MTTYPPRHGGQSQPWRTNFSRSFSKNGIHPSNLDKNWRQPFVFQKPESCSKYFPQTRRFHHDPQRNQPYGPVQNSRENCKFCGKCWTLNHFCPAKFAKCHICAKTGHFARMHSEQNLAKPKQIKAKSTKQKLRDQKRLQEYKERRKSMTLYPFSSLEHIDFLNLLDSSHSVKVELNAVHRKMTSKLKNDEKSILESKIDELEAEKDNLEKKVKEISAENMILENNVQTLKNCEKCAESSKELEILKQEYQHLSSTNRMLRIGYEEQTKEYNDTVKGMNTLQNSITSLKESIDGIATNNAKLQDENQELIHNIRTLERMVDDQNQYIDELREQASSHRHNNRTRHARRF